MGRWSVEDITGLRFNRLIAEEFLYEQDERTLWLWRFRCDCGNTIIASASKVKGGRIKSCGCRRLKGSADVRRKHGMAHTQVYKSWVRMIHRCYTPRNNRYKHYGGRGIGVCTQWRESVEDFIADMGHPPSPRHSLGRIDNDGDYTPHNCRWETPAQQARNKSNNVFIEYNGQTLTLTDWGSVTGIYWGTIRNRLHSGWSVEKALTTRIPADRPDMSNLPAKRRR